LQDTLHQHDCAHHPLYSLSVHGNIVYAGSDLAALSRADAALGLIDRLLVGQQLDRHAR
jgi:hypothetical protein